MFAQGQTADEGGGPRLGRDRVTTITAAAVVGIGVLAWVAVLADASVASMSGMSGTETSPGGMGGMDMAPAGVASSLPSAMSFLVSWGVMMAAMMLPSAAPMVALYGAVHRHADRTGQGVPRRGRCRPFYGLKFRKHVGAWGMTRLKIDSLERIGDLR